MYDAESLKRNKITLETSSGCAIRLRAVREMRRSLMTSVGPRALAKGVSITPLQKWSVLVSSGSQKIDSRGYRINSDATFTSLMSSTLRQADHTPLRCAIWRIHRRGPLTSNAGCVHNTPTVFDVPQLGLQAVLDAGQIDRHHPLPVLIADSVEFIIRTSPPSFTYCSGHVCCTIDATKLLSSLFDCILHLRVNTNVYSEGKSLRTYSLDFFEDTIWFVDIQ